MRTILLTMAVLFGAASQFPQDRDPLIRRWVGTHLLQPIFLDFFGDSMLVMQDTMALNYRATRDSIYVWGDTTFAVQYWFAAGRLLVLTEEGNILTMAEQDPLARPIWGSWRGSAITSSESIYLSLLRGGTAFWRRSGGEWTRGEWNRRSRTFTFVWEPDSLEWVGRYDPVGGALLFDSTYAESGTVVLRKIYR